MVARSRPLYPQDHKIPRDKTPARRGRSRRGQQERLPSQSVHSDVEESSLTWSAVMADGRNQGQVLQTNERANRTYVCVAAQNSNHMRGQNIWSPRVETQEGVETFFERNISANVQRCEIRQLGLVTCDCPLHGKRCDWR